MRRDVTITDLESWLSNFPDLVQLRFTVNGRPVQWTGGTRAVSYGVVQGDLSPVEEVITLEFVDGTSQIPQ